MVTIDYGDEVDFSGAAIVLPTQSSNTIGAVTRTIVMSGEPSAAAINKLVEFGE